MGSFQEVQNFNRRATTPWAKITHIVFKGITIMQILSRRRLAQAGLLFLLTVSSGLAACQNQAAAPAASPQEFLGALYSHYDGKGPGAGIDYSQSVELARYFTPETAALIAADFEKAKAANEVPVLNGDPFVGAQEWDVSNLDIAIGKTATPEQTMAMVRFESYGQTSEFRLDLQLVEAGWRIADIDWGYGTLRGILTE
jgi:hypothetical protein